MPHLLIDVLIYVPSSHQQKKSHSDIEKTGRMDAVKNGGQQRAVDFLLFVGVVGDKIINNGQHNSWTILIFIWVNEKYRQ